MYIIQMYQVKLWRGLKLKEEALIGAMFDGVMISIIICVFEFFEICNCHFPHANIVSIQDLGVELSSTIKGTVTAVLRLYRHS